MLFIIVSIIGQSKDKRRPYWTPFVQFSSEKSTTDEFEKFIPFRFHRCFIFCFHDQTEKRFRVGRADIEPPVGVFHGNAVEFKHVSIGIIFADRIQNRLRIRNFGIDFTTCDIFFQRFDQFADFFPLLQTRFASLISASPCDSAT